MDKCRLQIQSLFVILHVQRVHVDGERTAATYKDKLADLQEEGAKIFLRLHEATAFPAGTS